MTEHRPLFQINFVVHNLDRARDFYSRLGWGLVDGEGDRAAAEMSDSLTVDFDATGFRQQWDPAYTGGTGGSNVINIFVGERANVDALYAELTDAGYPHRSEPWDEGPQPFYLDPNAARGGSAVGLSMLTQAPRCWSTC